MEEVAKLLGKSVVNTIIDAIKSGRSKKEALEEAARMLKREDVVSDELFAELTRYSRETKSFEDAGL